MSCATGVDVDAVVVWEGRVGASSVANDIDHSISARSGLSLVESRLSMAAASRVWESAAAVSSSSRQEA